LFLLHFCQASDWQHNSSCQVVAVGILAAKDTAFSAYQNSQIWEIFVCTTVEDILWNYDMSTVRLGFKNHVIGNCGMMVHVYVHEL